MNLGGQLFLLAYSHTRLLFPESLRNNLLTQDPNFLLEDSWGHSFLSAPHRTQGLVMVVLHTGTQRLHGLVCLIQIPLLAERRVCESKLVGQTSS